MRLYFWEGAFSIPSVTELLEYITKQCCPFKKYTYEWVHIQSTDYITVNDN